MSHATHRSIHAVLLRVVEGLEPTANLQSLINLTRMPLECGRNRRKHVNPAQKGPHSAGFSRLAVW